MSTRSRWGLKFVAGLALVAGAFCGGKVAFSGKPPEYPPPQPPITHNVCDNKGNLETAHRLVAKVLETKVWTRRDQQTIGPLFQSLRSWERIELIQKIGAALNKGQLKVEKGARMF
jgi:hypothetical protein